MSPEQITATIILLNWPSRSSSILDWLRFCNSGTWYNEVRTKILITGMSYEHHGVSNHNSTVCSTTHANVKENIKAPYYLPFLMGIRRQPVDSSPKRRMRKGFPCWHPHFFIKKIQTNWSGANANQIGTWNPSSFHNIAFSWKQVVTTHTHAHMWGNISKIGTFNDHPTDWHWIITWTKPWNQEGWNHSQENTYRNR